MARTIFPNLRPHLYMDLVLLIHRRLSSRIFHLTNTRLLKLLTCQVIFLSSLFHLNQQYAFYLLIFCIYSQSQNHPIGPFAGSMVRRRIDMDEIDDSFADVSSHQILEFGLVEECFADSNDRATEAPTTTSFMGEEDEDSVGRSEESKSKKGYFGSSQTDSIGICVCFIYFFIDLVLIR